MYWRRPGTSWKREEVVSLQLSAFSLTSALRAAVLKMAVIDHRQLLTDF
jgi:hypothetical protein